MKMLAAAMLGSVTGTALFLGANEVTREWIFDTDEFGKAGAGETKSGQHGEYVNRAQKDMLATSVGGVAAGMAGLFGVGLAALRIGPPALRAVSLGAGLAAGGLSAGLLTNSTTALGAWVTADYEHDERSRRRWPPVQTLD